LVFILKLLKKNKYFILLFLVIGLCYGFYKSYNTHQLIEQTTICETRVISRVTLIRVVSDLKEKIASGDTQDLLNSIKNPNSLSTIASVQIDTLKDQNVVIKYSSANLSDISAAKKDFGLYLNTLFKSTIDKNLNSIYSMLSEITNMYVRPDSTQENYLQSNKKSHDGYCNPIAYKDNFDIFKLKHSLEESASVIKKDGILTEISCINKTIHGNSLTKVLFTYSLASVLLFVVLIFIIEFIKIINKRTK